MTGVGLRPRSLAVLCLLSERAASEQSKNKGPKSLLDCETPSASTQTIFTHGINPQSSSRALSQRLRSIRNTVSHRADPLFTGSRSLGLVFPAPVNRLGGMNGKRRICVCVSARRSAATSLPACQVIIADVASWWDLDVDGLGQLYKRPRLGAAFCMHSDMWTCWLTCYRGLHDYGPDVLGVYSRCVGGLLQRWQTSTKAYHRSAGWIDSTWRFECVVAADAGGREGMRCQDRPTRC